MKQNTVKHINKWPLLTVLLFIAAIAFLLLTYEVIKYPPSYIDLMVSSVIQGYHGPAMDQFMVFISGFGRLPFSVIMVLFCSGIFYFFGYRRPAAFTLLTLISGLISTVIKIMVNRPRPVAHLVNIIEVTKQQSFPSGHTLFYIIFFGFLIVVMASLKTIFRPVRITVTIFSAGMIFLIPFSRIYLGAHWVTDVIGSILLGMICLTVLSYFYLLPYSTGKDK